MNDLSNRTLVMRRVAVTAIFAVLAISLQIAPARALINPDFTPVQLVRQSEQILLLKFGPKSERGDIELTVDRPLVGETPEKSPVLSLRNL